MLNSFLAITNSYQPCFSHINERNIVVFSPSPTKFFGVKVALTGSGGLGIVKFVVVRKIVSVSLPSRVRV